MIVPFRTGADAQAAVPLVRAHFDRGGLIAYPTETVYGLGSRAEAGALAALARLKGRPPGKPFLLLVSSRTMAERFGLVFTPAARALADAFWPGPLTLVLRGGEGRLPDQLRGPEGGIAVRLTSMPQVAELIRGLDEPVTSTSANRPGQPTGAGVERIVEVFGDAERDGTLMILDGGTLGNVPPSTLVDCTGPVPVLVREGAIPRAELRRRVGRHAP